MRGTSRGIGRYGISIIPTKSGVLPCKGCRGVLSGACRLWYNYANTFFAEVSARGVRFPVYGDRAERVPQNLIRLTPA